MKGNHWVLLIGGVVFLGNAIHGLRAGRASVFVAPFERSEQPGMYWGAIVFSAVLGLGSLVTFAYDLFR
jgi:hypothetical protein